MDAAAAEAAAAAGVDVEFENAVGELVERNGVSVEVACAALVATGGDLAKSHLVCRAVDMFGASATDTVTFLQVR